MTKEKLREALRPLALLHSAFAEIFREAPVYFAVVFLGVLVASVTKLLGIW